PVVTHHQHSFIATCDDGEIAPSDLRHFLAHANNSLCPVQQRIGMSALDRGIDVLEAIRAAGDDWNYRLVNLGETAVWLVRPLHRRTCTIAFGKIEIVAHAELIAVTQDWGAGQREQQAVSELQPTAVTV